ncbi:type I-E CRISPR-associated endonuclease Cas1e [Arcanobacterium hippocoleae]|uniref:type I-E CRISPR-associated endonuclease Cas1e n=1 Tax=Arcanobacterium hippocoleae TaxID=149017 RepID=UPI00286C1130|nr:type I-E CRISPR-associated endonuclease Cas1e [Arcanobacterium hippocoleae]
MGIFDVTSRISLPRLKDRITFLYLEHCVVHRADGAITARNETGTINVPAAQLVCIMLGPGTSVSHQAVTLIAECGVTLVWVGENGVRYYAHGRSLAESNLVIQQQARLVTVKTERLRVAREMYAMRFPDEDTSGYTMQRLRGREGARIKAIYREEAERTGVAWKGRDYKPEDFNDSDQINQALSAANAALYGVVHSVIVGLGASPALGFIHSGHERSFVYDIADLYKAELSIPLAFDVVAAMPVNLTSAIRTRMRDQIFERKIIQRAVSDILTLLGAAKKKDEINTDVVTLWDFQRGEIEAGANYDADNVSGF